MDKYADGLRHSGMKQVSGDDSRWEDTKKHKYGGLQYTRAYPYVALTLEQLTGPERALEDGPSGRDT